MTVLRWLVAVLVGLLVFVGALSAAWWVMSLWMTRVAEADRWVIATAFAAVMAAAVGGWAAWWAARDRSPATGGSVSVQGVQLGHHNSQHNRFG